MNEQPLILIVDDDPDIREGISAVLETRDYRIATANDGLQCMESIHQETPKLLILDMMMPRMDGFAVINELRADPRYAGLPIIILTTVIEDAAYRRYELETGIAMDVQAYIEKPAPPDELLRQVSAIVDQPYIIVADDDPDILEAITTILETQSYQIATAIDGMKCLELVRKRKPDVVLTTVVEDASRRRYELETGQDMAVEAYLQKPVAPDELLRLVGTAIEVDG